MILERVYKRINVIQKVFMVLVNKRFGEKHKKNE